MNLEFPSPSVFKSGGISSIWTYSKSSFAKCFLSLMKPWWLGDGISCLIGKKCVWFISATCAAKLNKDNHLSIMNQALKFWHFEIWRKEMIRFAKVQFYFVFFPQCFSHGLCNLVTCDGSSKTDFYLETVFQLSFDFQWSLYYMVLLCLLSKIHRWNNFLMNI